MSKIKIQCSSCGYTLQEGDGLKCPICGGIMAPIVQDKACDKEEEKRWNNGYHNDFEEGRKTGSYCDSNLEKYTNGGEHYHPFENTNKTVVINKTTTQRGKVTLNSPYLKNGNKIITFNEGNNKGIKILMFVLGCFIGCSFNILSLFAIIPIKRSYKDKPIEQTQNIRTFTIGMRVGLILVILFYVIAAIIGASDTLI